MKFVTKTLVPVFFVLVFAVISNAATDCNFDVQGTVLHLTNDCSMDEKLYTSEYTDIKGHDHKITFVNPPVGYFQGGLITLAPGSSLAISDLKIDTSNLVGVCEVGDNRLFGIMSDIASLQLTNVEITNIKKQSLFSIFPCEEGYAVMVRNMGADAEPVSAVFDRVYISGYQKAGIIMNGKIINPSISRSVIDSGGAAGDITRYGAQMAYGVTNAMVRDTEIKGNSRIGTGSLAIGLYIVGGPGISAESPDYCTGNMVVKSKFTNNDVGVYLWQRGPLGAAPATDTNNKVMNNEFTNDFINRAFQAGVVLLGRNDKVDNNTFRGIGYLSPGMYEVNQNPELSPEAKVHAIK